MRFPLVLAGCLVSACGALLGVGEDDVERPIREDDAGADATVDDAPSETARGESSPGDAAIDVDAADVAPPRTKRVFVTSMRIAPSFGSLAGADAVCDAFAADAGAGSGIQGSEFFAFVAGPNGETPESRVVAQPYARMDGTIVFPNGPAVDPVPTLQIAFDEKLGNHATEQINKEVWTGLATGFPNAAARTCAGWTSTASTDFAGYGEVPFTALEPSGWKTSGGKSLDCGQLARLYCFEK